MQRGVRRSNVSHARMGSANSIEDGEGGGRVQSIGLTHSAERSGRETNYHTTHTSGA